MKIRNYIDIGLVVLLGIGWVYTKQVETSRDKMLLKVGYLDDQLNAQIDLSLKYYTEYKRLKDGTVKKKKTFIPPEGSVKLGVPKDSDSVKDVKVKLKTKGFTFRPGLSLSYWDKLEVGGSFKVVYWSRYSLLTNIDRQGLGAGVSRYIDDLIPYWRPQNLEVFIAYRVLTFTRYSDKLNIGVRITL